MLNTKMIGERISDARKTKNLSQAQLAEQLFISAQAVGKWERGESLPDIIMLNRLSEILNVDLNYFSANPEQTIPEKITGSQQKQPAEQESLRAGAGNKPNWDMSSGNWLDADFSGLKNLHEKFSSSNMQRCKFVGSDLSGLLLKHNNILGCDFSASDLGNSQVQGSNLSENQFWNCSLKGTAFSGSFISGCDFTGADFTGVTMRSGGLEKNTVSNAVWSQTVFSNSHLIDLEFTGTLEDCSFENCSFKRVTFQNARLINTFFKNNKNLKRARFVDCEADRMTFEFLKSGNADVSGIRLING